MPPQYIAEGQSVNSSLAFMRGGRHERRVLPTDGAAMPRDDRPCANRSGKGATPDMGRRIGQSGQGGRGRGEKSEPAGRPALLIRGMMDPAEFLLRKAEEIRALASTAPELASDLRQMAEECRQAATEPRQHRRRDAHA